MEGIYERNVSVSDVVGDGGELLSHIERRVYLVKGGGRYVTLYDYRFLYSLSGVHSGLLLWMSFESKYNTNLVILDDKYIEDNLELLRIGNLRRFKVMVRRLEGLRLIFRRTRNSWVINPMFFFRGSQKVRKELIKQMIMDGKDLSYGDE